MTLAEHKNLAEALVAFQAEAPTLPKDSTNPHFKSRFTSLDAIVETIRPLLAKHGLAWSTKPSFGPGGEPALKYRLTHKGGEWDEDVMPLLLDKTNSQGLGSAISYARRYSVTAVLNLATGDDDDGYRASQPQQAPRNDLVSGVEIKALQGAAKGLSTAQIKGAMTSCGIAPPDPFVPQTCFTRIPKLKAEVLREALMSDLPFEGPEQQAEELPV